MGDGHLRQAPEPDPYISHLRSEKSASGTLAKRPKRKSREEKRIQALQMVEWATDISGKHPNLIHTFLTSDRRSRPVARSRNAQSAKVARRSASRLSKWLNGRRTSPASTRT